MTLALAGGSVAIVAAVAGAWVGSQLTEGTMPAIGSFEVASAEGAGRTGLARDDASELRAASSTTSAPARTTTSTTAVVTTTETTVLQPAGDVRTYVLTGGTVTLNFADERVAIVEIVAAEGFTADEPILNGRTTQVSFRSEEHHSHLEAWIDGGPQVTLDDH